uniref:Uncharacterized protein n=1 Tax=Rhizophora mucronata TaxID=61149 RepID=A0A2P2Q665_RHIMU
MESHISAGKQMPSMSLDICQGTNQKLNRKVRCTTAVHCLALAIELWKIVHYLVWVS